MFADRIHLVVGLGNPGHVYELTRHNAGFIAIDALSQKHSICLKQSAFDSVYGIGEICSEKVILAKPMSYMNRSGLPVNDILKKFRIQCRELIVIHDDIDLAFGRIKIKEKGGHAGHKGIKSIMETVGRGDFVRVRIGIDRPPQGENVPEYVLGEFDSPQKESLISVISCVEEAVATVLDQGTTVGMNRFNSRSTILG